MKLSEVMTRKVEFVAPFHTVRDAAEKMRSFDVGPMPVCDAGRVVGMLTDRDIAVRVVAAGRSPETTQVKDVMSCDVSFCHQDDEVAAAAKLMADKQLRRLVILGPDKQLAGIVSVGDLAMSADGPKLMGPLMENVSRPAPHAALKPGHAD